MIKDVGREPHGPLPTFSYTCCVFMGKSTYFLLNMFGTTTR